MLRKVNIEKTQIALVLKGEQLLDILTAGEHWVFGNKEVNVYSLQNQFIAPFDLRTMIHDPMLSKHLEVIDIPDNHIALRFEEGVFKEVLSTGIHAFWKALRKHTFTMVNLNGNKVSDNIPAYLLKNGSLKHWTSAFSVEHHAQGLLFIDGKFVELLSSGTHYFWNNGQRIHVLNADMRNQIMEVSGQELLTKDKAAVRINFFSHFKISDVHLALIENRDFEKQLYVQIQLALRAYVGGFTLDELLSKKEHLAETILNHLREKAKHLGVFLLDTGVKDIILPGEMREIMNQVLIAEKRAQANSIMRREETAATRNLLNTAKLMEENSTLMKLKEMEYVEKIADKVGEISISGGGNALQQLKEIFVK